ncbi:hypothetical protein B0H13DRAFT_2543219 [Mycena leptocephala]|nr:hypothetical protein B0H13DRAFT_2543219 [Mycena leptocephala]
MYLESVRKELAELETSITPQRLRLQELEELLTLPPEITAEIFLQEVLLLLSICRAWRALALSVPALWATLDIETLPSSRNAPEEMQEIVEAWFSRAGALPLSLTCRHAPRLQTLNLCISSIGFSHLDDGIPFPLLQRLRLSNLTDPLNTPLSTFIEAPQLRHVELDGIPPSSLILPWAQLETFSTEGIPAQECLDVLRAAPSLRKFEPYRAFTDSFNDNPIILHARLTSFHLISGNPEIMRYLAFPALKDLCFSSFSGLDDDILLPFLLRTRGSLRTFTISYGGRHLLSLSIQWFRHMPHLTSLDLGDLELQSRVDFVRALNRQNERSFLPVLENLTLTWWDPDGVDTQLLDAVDTRCTARTETEDGHVAQMPLKSFRLIWLGEYPGCRATSLDLANLVQRHGTAFRDLQRRGMGVHLGTKEKNYL